MDVLEERQKEEARRIPSNFQFVGAYVPHTSLISAYVRVLRYRFGWLGRMGMFVFVFAFMFPRKYDSDFQHVACPKSELEFCVRIKTSKFQFVLPTLCFDSRGRVKRTEQSHLEIWSS